MRKLLASAFLMIAALGGTAFWLGPPNTYPIWENSKVVEFSPKTTFKRVGLCINCEGQTCGYGVYFQQGYEAVPFAIVYEPPLNLWIQWPTEDIFD